MRVTLKQLLVFDAVVRLGSVSEAACEVSLTQSAASMALQELERQLGCELFDRQNRRLIPNEHGRRLQPKARSVLLGIGDIEQMGNGASSFKNILTIGAEPVIGNYLLPEICAAFLVRHPHICLHLEILPTLEVIQSVDAMKIDIGFVNVSKTRPTLRSLAWKSDEQVIFASPSHPLARKKGKIKPGDLQNVSWCLMPRGSVHRIILVVSLQRYLASINGGLECDSPEMIKRAVQAGAGVGCLSRWAIHNELKAGTLKEIPVAGLDMVFPMSVIAREEIQLGDAYEEFIRLAMDMSPL